MIVWRHGQTLGAVTAILVSEALWGGCLVAVKADIAWVAFAPALDARPFSHRVAVKVGGTHQGVIQAVRLRPRQVELALAIEGIERVSMAPTVAFVGCAVVRTEHRRTVQPTPAHVADALALCPAIHVKDALAINHLVTLLLHTGPVAAASVGAFDFAVPLDDNRAVIARVALHALAPALDTLPVAVALHAVIIVGTKQPLQRARVACPAGLTLALVVAQVLWSLGDEALAMPRAVGRTSELAVLPCEGPVASALTIAACAVSVAIERTLLEKLPKVSGPRDVRGLITACALPAPVTHTLALQAFAMLASKVLRASCPLENCTVLPSVSRRAEAPSTAADTIATTILAAALGDLHHAARPTIPIRTVTGT